MGGAYGARRYSSPGSTSNWVKVVQNIMNAYSSGVTVPAWPSGDFDSLYVVRLTNTSGVVTAQFEHAYEGLNNLPTTCPN